jgi:hypothetical protein
MLVLSPARKSPIPAISKTRTIRALAPTTSRSWPLPRLHSSPDSARQLGVNRPANSKIDVARFSGYGPRSAQL